MMIPITLSTQQNKVWRPARRGETTPPGSWLQIQHVTCRGGYAVHGWGDQVWQQQLLRFIACPWSDANAKAVRLDRHGCMRRRIRGGSWQSVTVTISLSHCRPQAGLGSSMSPKEFPTPAPNVRAQVTRCSDLAMTSGNAEQRWLKPAVWDCEGRTSRSHTVNLASLVTPPCWQESYNYPCCKVCIRKLEQNGCGITRVFNRTCSVLVLLLKLHGSFRVKQFCNRLK